MDELTLRPLPWVDPSTMYLPDYCTWRLYIQKVCDKDFVTARSIVGTDFHLIHKWSWPKFDSLRLTDFAHEGRVTDVPLYAYFRDTMVETMPDDEKEEKNGVVVPTNKHLAKCIANYAKWLVGRLRVIVSSLSPSEAVLEKYFFPRLLEHYMEDEDEKIYGTLDAVYNLSPIEGGGVAVCDIKTGKVPPKRDKISTPIMRQLHTYVHLLLKNADKLGLKDITMKDMKVMLVYVSDPKEPVELKRNANMLSVNAVFRHRDKVLDIWKNKSYSKPDEERRYYVCRTCPAAIECLTDEEAVKYSNYSKDYAFKLSEE